MSDKSGIQWTDATWNPTSGCDRVSPGCDHCYAMTLAKRLKAMGSPRYQVDGDPRTSGPGFGVQTHAVALDQPIRWKRPRRIFVNSMSDLFHEQVPDEFISRVFAVMAASPQHTFQCLTKRHARLRSLLRSQAFRHDVARHLDGLRVDQAHDPVEAWAPIPQFDGYGASSHGRLRGPSGTILATCPNPVSGRATVTLWNHGSPQTVFVHRAVLSAFSEQLDPATEACHRNGNKLDNRLANLRWGTRSENQLEKTRHGSRGGPAKLALKDAEAIRDARRLPKGERPTQQDLANQYRVSRPLISLIESGAVWGEPDLEWPLPNVWLGVSVEDQKWADIRIPALLETPAAVRFLSLEPLLGPVSLRAWTTWSDRSIRFSEPDAGVAGLDWAIVGGESGPGARPMDPEWVRSLVVQCVEAEVVPFVKQLGACWAREHGGDSHGGDWSLWPDDLRIREFPAPVPAAA